MHRTVVEPGRARVSVVIPVKDDAALLERCLAALDAQTRPADEVIVVDNNSADDSAEVARRAGARVIPCPAPGIPAASATGYDAARGDYILRLDADCVPAVDWVAVMAETFDHRPEVDVATNGAHFIDGPRLFSVLLANLYLGAYVACTFPALGHTPVFGSNLAFRRSAWQDVRRRVHRRSDIHDDLDLSFHLGRRHRIVRVPAARMAMSARPLRSARGLRRRTAWAMRTVLIHWPIDFPVIRWARLLARAAVHEAWAVLRRRVGSP